MASEKKHIILWSNNYRKIKQTLSMHGWYHKQENIKQDHKQENIEHDKDEPIIELLFC